MPNIICSVCQSEVSVELGHLAAAACGHTFHSDCLNQWLQKGTKTCPVCRKPTKSSLALFIDIAPEEDSAGEKPKSNDVLRCRVESLEFQLKLKAEETRKSVDKAAILEQNKKDLRLEAKRLENLYKAENDRARSFESQLQYVTKELSAATAFRDETLRLRVQVESLKSAKLILQGTEEDVEDIIGSYLDKSDEMRSLATYCVMLKKELVKSQESKGRGLDDINRSRKENGTLRVHLKSAEKRVEEVENALCKLDSENIRLQRKLEKYEGKRRQMAPSSDLNITAVSVAEEVRTPETKKKRNNDAFDSPASFTPEIAAQSRHARLHPNAMDVNPEVLPVSASQPSSSEGSSKTDIDINDMTIMRKRPALGIMSPRKDADDSDVGFDGMGGSSRPDVFPIPRGSSKGFLKTSVKFKSGNKVKSAKITEFITLE